MLGKRVYYYPRVDSPIMIAALPDMGNVAGLGIDYLLKNVKSDVFAEIYAYWPLFVTYKNGVADYKQSVYKFHYAKDDRLLIFSGEFNPRDPRRLYEICYEVVTIAQRLNVKRLYSIGAALRSSVVERRIFAVANSEHLINEMKNYGIKILEGEGEITGFNGLVLGIAKERGIDAVCLLGEIDNPNIIQPNAAQKLLESLIMLTGIKPFSMEGLEEEERRKKFLERQMAYIGQIVDKGGPPGIA